MATTVVDVRDLFAPPSFVVPPAVGGRPSAAAPGALRRVPLTALAAGALGILQGVGLLAFALTGLDGVLAPASRPAVPLLVTGLLVFAGWIVLAAGTGAGLLDGTGRRCFVGLALTEIGLVAVVTVGAAVASVAGGVDVPFSMPTVVALAAALPVAKLLLAGTPAARQWVAQGPRVREAAPDPVTTHRVLATLTLGTIGAVLVALTVLAPVGNGGGHPDAPVVTSVHQP